MICEKGITNHDLRETRLKGNTMVLLLALNYGSNYGIRLRSS